MNTIRRTIEKIYPCSSSKIDQRDELSFEGEKGKFYICIDHFNPYEGTKRVRMALDKEDAEILYKSLSNFLK